MDPYENAGSPRVITLSVRLYLQNCQIPHADVSCNVLCSLAYYASKQFRSTNNQQNSVNLIIVPYSFLGENINFDQYTFHFKYAFFLTRFLCEHYTFNIKYYTKHFYNKVSFLGFP